MSLSTQSRPLLAVAFAALAAASMWFYARHVVAPIQGQNAAKLNRPHGNLSDLYPRWLGARELLLRGRNPYGPEVTREIQRGYYGRELDPTSQSDPKDEVRFAYPVYAIFFLAPSVRMDFAVVRVVAGWLLGALGLGSVLLWAQALHVSLPRGGGLTAVLLMLGTYPFVEAVALQQPVLLVAALLAASFLARNRGWLFLSGVLLALATVKPQVAALPVILMLMWASANWRERRRWLWGFGFTMVGLFTASEYILSGWLFQFFDALRAYKTYMAGTAFLDYFLTPRWTWLGQTMITLCVLWVAWKARNRPTDSVLAGQAAALCLVAAVCNSPNFGTYNQILLAPGLLLVFRQWDVLQQGRMVPQNLSRLVVLLIGWAWMACGILFLAQSLFHSPQFVARFWQVPLFGTLELPLVLLALLLAMPTEGTVRRSLASVPRGVSCALST